MDHVVGMEIVEAFSNVRQLTRISGLQHRNEEAEKHIPGSVYPHRDGS